MRDGRSKRVVRTVSDYILTAIAIKIVELNPPIFGDIHWYIWKMFVVP